MIYKRVLSTLLLLFVTLSTIVAEESDKKVGNSSYDKIITAEATSSKGVIDIHQVKSNLYLEIPVELMGRSMLFAARVVETSDNKDVIAGQMPNDPLLIEWSYDDEKVYLHESTTNNIYREGESIAVGYERNNLTPILRAFPIKCFNGDSTSVVIDVTKYYLSDQKPFSPFLRASAIDMMLGNKRMSGSFKGDMSSILSFESFPLNLNVTTRLVFTVRSEPFTAVVTSSMLLLPEEPMKPRFADNRVGYFTEDRKSYSTKESYIQNVKYINRWRIEPKPEDVERHKRGELVEPAKQIVYQIDPSFPEEWKPFIKKGVEAWQPLFEEIGFKNAIVAKEIASEEKFNPADFRNSCIIYSPSDFANAMGPSWKDPRSGEIIQGSVYIYHNVLSLVHGWRFIQTAAVDPAARSKNYDIKMMGPLLEYLIVHEVGHTLGLAHNMRASYAFPVDSLRSPYFTEKYGTTSSVMDYARFNYIAQPGDGVTEFAPKIGPYDYFAIKYGYQILHNAKSDEEERAQLNKWVTSLASDPIYKFGEQRLFGRDPASLSESLGDDAVKAGEYGIKNLQVIIENLLEWTTEEGGTFDHTAAMYEQVHRQFVRYMNHALTLIGGYHNNNAVVGDGQVEIIPISKEKQREALHFILNSVYNYPDWMVNRELLLMSQILTTEQIDAYPVTVLRSLLGTSTLAGVTNLNAIAEDPYTLDQYLDDIYSYVWDKALNREALNDKDRSFTYAWLQTILGELEMLPAQAQAPKKRSLTAESATSMTQNTKEPVIKILAKPSLFLQLQKARTLLERSAKRGLSQDRHHYQYLLYQLERLMD